MLDYNPERIRRELDKARERAEAVVLTQKINGLENPFLETAIELTAAEEALYDRWSMTSEPLLYARHKLVSWYAWAIPDDSALAAVGETGSVVEIGAGGGYWAAMLRARGVEVFAYDPKPGQTVWSEKVWTDIEVGHTKPAEQHPESTLFLCWPAYQSQFALRALRGYLRAGGERVVYVGEHDGGCCATEGFFDLLETECKQTADSFIPQFPGMHDYLTVWEPRK